MFHNGDTAILSHYTTGVEFPEFIGTEEVEILHPVVGTIGIVAVRPFNSEDIIHAHIKRLAPIV